MSKHSSPWFSSLYNNFHYLLVETLQKKQYAPSETFADIELTSSKLFSPATILSWAAMVTSLCYLKDKHPFLLGNPLPTQCDPPSIFLHCKVFLSSSLSFACGTWPAEGPLRSHEVLMVSIAQDLTAQERSCFQIFCKISTK